ncbi:hypothetical protein [Paraburkholderia ginsengisoli]|uniref:Phage holin n=1 Tax=Paraburkholderia ginsengisoli TaxID=311231 RepID=A0A7T4N443_9BURK|nr:hypothetical protein [Paraburkholderia ginsengisoli]QQC64883.1 hypothetical protein I6I06_05245 [Paraburkholderia ginsengisoli]
MWEALAGLWNGDDIHAAIAVGNVCGAFVYLLETTESRRGRKYVYAVIAAILGYGIAPWAMERLPWMPRMMGGALSSALVVGALIAAFKQAEKFFPSIASRISEEARKRITGSYTGQ